jgi:hypothetical protein
MKYHKYFIRALFIMFITLSCESTLEQNNFVKLEVVKEDMVNNYQFPEDGYYYEYQFESFDDNFTNVEDTLKKYIQLGVKLMDAWHHNGSRNCRPPNSQFVTHVIVDPKFVLRLETKADDLINQRFILVKKPPYFFCGYSVNHYVVKNY